MRRVARISTFQIFVFVAFVTFTSLATNAADSTHRARGAQSTGFAFWSSDASGRPMNFTMPSSPDNWLGGTGNWSNGADWSAGEPGSSSDVFINTGNDYVTLDTGASINSLTIGGSSGSSMLQETQGRGFVVDIAGALTINQTGTLTLVQDAIFAASASNAGTINLSGQAQLSLNNNFSNSGTINLFTGSNVLVSGNVNNSGQILGLDQAFETLMAGGNLTNSGSIINDQVLVTGTTTNQSHGLISAQPFVASGNVINQGEIMGLARGSLLMINGELTNSGTFDTTYANGTLGSLNNLAGGTVIAGSLTINGDSSNAGGIGVTAIGRNEPLTVFQLNGNLTNPGGLYITGSPFGGEEANVTGSIANSGTIGLSTDGVFASGNISNSGMIVTGTQGGGSGGNQFSAGKLTNLASGIVSLNGMGDVANFASVTNAGSVSVADSATLKTAVGSHASATALGGFVNSGSVMVAGGGTISSPAGYLQTAGQTIVDGKLSGASNFAGGSVYGNNGTISGNVSSDASFNIGDAPMTVGEMSIMGNYTQRANGSLTFDIASLTQYDQLNVSGHAQLNGLMTVNLLNGYIPQVGNMFDIMNFASESGTFSTVVGLPINNQEHFTLEYNATNLTLDVVSGPGMQASWRHGSSSGSEPFITPLGDNLSFVSNVDSQPTSSAPEPGSILLFGSGLAGIAAILRRTR